MMPSTHMTPGPASGGPATTVAAVEALLEEWFGRPVVLTSSGRGAILLLLRHWGFSRYRDHVALPRFISACVMDAVVRAAFPRDAAVAPVAEAFLLYHQYGFPQRRRPPGLVLEDICHAFFATAHDGGRDWMGDAAVFSLPKFMPTAAMVGGIVAADSQTAGALRALRDDCNATHLFTSTQMGDTFRTHYHNGGAALEEVYLARLVDPRVYEDDVAGLPVTIAALRDIGARRQTVTRYLFDATDGAGLPPDWMPLLRDNLPFLFPVAGTPESLAAAHYTLQENGVKADIHTVDLARDMRTPDLTRLLMVPCHHEISDTALDVIIRALNEITV